MTGKGRAREQRDKRRAEIIREMTLYLVAHPELRVLKVGTVIQDYADEGRMEATFDSMALSDEAWGWYTFHNMPHLLEAIEEYRNLP